MSVNKDDRRSDQTKRNNTRQRNTGRSSRTSPYNRTTKQSSPARERSTSASSGASRRSTSSSPPRRLTAKGRELQRLEEIRRRKQQRMQILILSGVGVLALLLVVIFVIFPVLSSKNDPKKPGRTTENVIASGDTETGENKGRSNLSEENDDNLGKDPEHGSGQSGYNDTPEATSKEPSSEPEKTTPPEPPKETASEPPKETPSETPKETEPPTPETEEETEPPVLVEPATCRMVFVGDNLLHWTIQQSGMYTAEDGTTQFNYDHLYRNISPHVSAADIAVINQEVVTGGVELGLSTYPSFNAPCQIGDAVANAGFDVATMATNHIMDKGEEGVANMLSYWHSHVPQVLTTGAYTSQEDRDTLPIYESNGLKIAFLNYTYGSNGGRGYYRYTINCLADKEQLVSDIERAKREADYVVVCPHWGIEKSFDISAEQIEYMQLFADLGVDLVVGTHPHVVQPVQCYTNSEGHPMYVFYSLGNVISLQSTTPQMLGGYADITIHRDEHGNITVEQAKMDFTVTHFKYDPSILLYYDITSYLWEDYTPELASVHGMNVLDPDNWSYEALKQLVDKYSEIRR